MAGKTAKKTAPGRPFRKGYDPRRGSGKKGRSGRLPDEFKQLLASLASREETIKALEQILSDPSHPQFMQALKFTADRGYGPPKQAVEVDPTGPILVMSDINALKGTG